MLDLNPQTIMKRIILLLSLCATPVSQAQELESILLAAQDAERLTQDYIEPALKGLVYSMNEGWYTTGKTHGVLGFDVTFGVNMALVPNSDKTFLFRASDYNFVRSQVGDTESVSTVLGDDPDGTFFDVRVPVGDGTFKVAEFQMPGGIGPDFPLKGVATPMIQFGVGLPSSTDLKVRFLPNIGVNDKVNNFMYGIGLQHDLTQYLPGLSATPFSLSALVAYSNTKVTYTIDDEDNLDDVSVVNGEGLFALNTLSFQAIGSVNLAILEFYASAGYGRGGSRLELNGDYTLTYDLEDGNGIPLGQVNETITNPLQFKANVNSPRFGLGMRVNLAIFKLFASYTIQEYNTFSTGIAVSVR